MKKNYLFAIFALSLVLLMLPMATSATSSTPTGSLAWTSTDGTATGSGTSLYEAVTALNAVGGGTIVVSGTVQHSRSTVLMTPITILPDENSQFPAVISSSNTRLCAVSSGGSLTLGKAGLAEDSLIISESEVYTYHGTYGWISCEGDAVTIHDGVTLQGPSDDTGYVSGIRMTAGTLTMDGGVIEGFNEGVYLYGTDVSFTMSGGRISNNTGSGIWDYVSSFVTIYGGTISNNNFFGVYHASNSPFTMYDGLITGNTVPAPYSGGGICAGGGTVTILGGSITNNSSGGGGGGIYAACTSLTIKDATITGNSAKSTGGGIYYDPRAATGAPSVLIENCNISNNVLDSEVQYSFGAGLCIRNTANECENLVSVTIMDSIISGNRSTTSSTSLGNAGSGAGLALGPTVNVVIGGTTQIKDNFTASVGGGIAEFETGNRDKQRSIITIQDNVVISGNQASCGGNIKANQGTWIIKDNVVIENGVAQQGGGILALGGSLTIRDNAVIRDNQAALGAGVFLGTSYRAVFFDIRDNDGDCTMLLEGGAISGNTALSLEGATAILAATNPTGADYFSSWKDILSQLLPTANTSGGGVFVRDGVLTLTGGEISRNSAYAGGGVALENDPKTSHNPSWFAAQSLNHSGHLLMQGGSIRENTAEIGGGLYLFDAPRYAVGDYNPDNFSFPYYYGATATLTGGSITGNTAVQTAGGIYLNPQARLILEGSPVVTGNTANGEISNTWLTYDAEAATAYLEEYHDIVQYAITGLANCAKELQLTYDSQCCFVYPEQVDAEILNYFMTSIFSKENFLLLLQDFSTVDELKTALYAQPIYQYILSVYTDKDPAELARLNLTEDCTLEDVQAAYLPWVLPDVDPGAYYILEYCHIAKGRYLDNPDDLYAKVDYDLWEAYSCIYHGREVTGVSTDVTTFVPHSAVLNTGVSFVSISGALTDKASIGLRSESPIQCRLVGEAFGAYTITDSDQSRFSDDAQAFSVVLDGEDANASGYTNELMLYRAAAPAPVAPITPMYILHYESNGGTVYPDEQYAANTVVTLDKLPAREGYVFTGWFADAALTQPIASVTMTSDKTVYAGWRAATVPDMLNGDDHFAYVIGYPDGNVRPLANIARSEVAAIFFRLLQPAVRDGNLTGENGFNDVSEDEWYNLAVSTLAKLDIFKGRTADTFAPDATITRAEFATICARFDTSITQGNSNFTDIEGHWAQTDIERAASLGWIQGYPDGTFRPDQPIARAEAMTMINRVLCRIPEEESDLLAGMNIWPDNLPGTWYYLAVQEATNTHDYLPKGEIYETWIALLEDPDWTRYQ